MRQFFENIEKTLGYWGFNKPEVSLYRASVGVLLALSLVLISYFSPLRELVKQTVRLPADFAFRHWIGKSPRLNEKIAVFAVDNATVNEAQTAKLDLNHWSSILEALKAGAPKAVLIHQYFDTPYKAEEAQSFVNALRGLPFPVHSGAFEASSPISYQPLLDNQTSGFALKDWIKDGKFSRSAPSIKKLPIHKYHFAYGPHPTVRGAFDQVGHFFYKDLNVPLFYRIDSNHAIPSATLLLISESIYFKKGVLHANGSKVPLDNKGEVLVNFVPPETFEARIQSLSDVLVKIRQGSPITNLPKDAFVVLVPGMYSGIKNTVLSPHGEVPASYATLSVLNSILNQSWLKTVPYGWIWVILFGLVGALLAYAVRGTWLWIGAISIPTFSILLGLGLFSFAGIDFPWLFCTSSFMLSFGFLTYENIQITSRKKKKLRETLSSMLAPAALEHILRSPSQLQLDATGRVVTVMFIDIVGSYVWVERQTPREAFHRLKTLLNHLTKTIHKHGGVIDKSLGDGLICFFGYHYNASEPQLKHADQALACALEIQQWILERNLEAVGSGQPLCPLRIGINTTAAYIGNIGTLENIDLTLIGHGVNYAKRLESACEEYGIMMGASTRDMLVDLDSSQLKLQKRFIQIKHFDELVEAYECHPFQTTQKFQKAITAFRDQLGKERKDPRFPIPDGLVISLIGTAGKGKLLDYSESGMSISFDRYLARGVSIELDMDSPDGAFRKAARRTKLKPSTL